VGSFDFPAIWGNQEGKSNENSNPVSDLLIPNQHQSLVSVIPSPSPYCALIRKVWREKIESTTSFFGHNGTGIAGDEGGVHELICVIRGRVFYFGDVVAKLSGKANRRFHARVCYQPDDDELMNAMLFELQIQIGKLTRAVFTAVALVSLGSSWMTRSSSPRLAKKSKE
jgi:hypothetical protein